MEQLTIKDVASIIAIIRMADDAIVSAEEKSALIVRLSNAEYLGERHD